MNTRPRVTVHFHAPLEKGPVPVTVTLPTGQPDPGTMDYPLEPALISSALRLIEGPENIALELQDPDRGEAIAAALAGYGLWEGGHLTGAPAPDPSLVLGNILGRALRSHPAIIRGIAALIDASVATVGELALVFEIEAASLATLPWELARDELGSPLLTGKGRTLACTRHIRFTHQGPLERRRLSTPPRVLLISPQAWINSELRAFTERARAGLREALAPLGAIVEELPVATLATLDERLRAGPPVDILDYVGHGVFRNGRGTLVMDGADGKVQFVSAAELAALPHLPPLITLNSCLGAYSEPEEPLGGLAVGLSAAGVPFVVAMQFSVRASSVADFVVPAFYEELATGNDISVAVAEVRRRLLVSEPNGMSWHLPTLYVAQPQPLSLITPPLVTAMPNPFLAHLARDDHRYFVGREQPLAQAWAVLRARNNVSFYGEPGCGKTATLALLRTRVAAQLGSHVKTVSLPIHYNIGRKQLVQSLIRQVDRSQGGTDDFEDVLAGQNIIIFLDNLHELDPDTKPAFAIRSWLRSLTQVPADQYIVQLVGTSILPLEKHFPKDKHRSSPLHDVMRDSFKLEPLDEKEARAFVAAHLAGSPFQVDQFHEIVVRNLFPEDLRRACQHRWDELVTGSVFGR